MSQAPDALGSLLSADEPAAAYRVLARKYRPHSFDDLIGQDAMVRTLSNAFALGRIHQAYLLCGVRGVGKTTTARILARALNYHRPHAGDVAGIDAPTVAMDALGTHCQAIIDSRHIDVIEIDAASHTGIDDIREVIDGVRYRPVMARYKVYIVDEVHMLSKAAFNGLLKTLEEPPAHVKFLFATTESDKVPVTVRSRCQRFDLRRIEPPTLVAHLQGICAREGAAVDEEALALIARAAEGSVRDALSLLDQAIAHGGDGPVGAATVRLMLGTADAGRVIDLFEAVMGGRVAAALGELEALHAVGADPLGVLAQLADFVHLVTRIKLVPEAARDPALTAEERVRGAAFAAALGVPVLTRAWQLLGRGMEEVRAAPRPLAAADMVLVRLAYAADLPTPDEAIRRLGSAGSTEGRAPAPPSRGPNGAPAVVARSGAPAAQALVAPPPAPAGPVLRGIEDLRALAAEHRDIQLKTAIERDVRLVRLEPGRLEFEAVPGAQPQLAAQLTRRLAEWTGTRWMVSLAPGGGAPTLRERAAAEAEQRREALAAHPVVARVLELFPGSRVIPPAAREAEAPAPPPVPDEPPDMPPLPDDLDEIYPADEAGPDDDAL